MPPPPGDLAAYALTAAGARLAERIAAALGAELRVPGRLAPLHPGARPFDRLGPALAEGFRSRRGHVVVAATGLVVRLIAPLLAGKAIDPAVVCVGQDGRFAVSLVSGHLGGANDLARSVALVTGGSAVISTATDLAGAPALEIVARDLGLVPESLRPLPAAAAALVDGAPLPVYDPMGLFLPALAQWPDLFIPAGDPGRLPEGGPSVSVDCRLRDLPSGCLALRPPVLAAGLGCHRDCPPEVLSDLLLAALREAGLSPKSVAVLATIDRRASAELAPAVLSAAWGKPLIGYEPRALAGVDVPTPSEAVARNIGVASVCEAAAILAARGGPLLAPKRKGEGATCALALIRST